MSASTLRGCDPWTFLDYMLRATVSKRFATFEDSWDPEFLLRRHGFDCLFVGETMAESVLAFETQPNGDATLRIAFTAEAGAREERLICVQQGDVKYMLLLEEVQAQYRRLGNHHWGTQFDVNNLSEALDVGILMFCDRLQAGGAQMSLQSRRSA